MIRNILIAGDLGRLRSDLVKSRDEKLFLQNQEELAYLITDSDGKKFVDYFKSRCKTEALPELGSTPPPKNCLTEAQFSDPPQDTEQALFDELKNLPQSLASFPAFWASYHLKMIEAGLIEPSYLAKTYASITGRARIEKALSSSEDQKPGKLDACVRTVLRRMGGLPEVRGSVSVFQDCRTARSWWRGFFVEEVCRDLGVDRSKAWEVLRTNEIWTQLTGYVVQKLTVLGDARIRTPLIAYFAEMDPVPNDRERIQGILNRIGQRTAYQMMGVLSRRENLEIIRTICA